MRQLALPSVIALILLGSPAPAQQGRAGEPTFTFVPAEGSTGPAAALPEGADRWVPPSQKRRKPLPRGTGTLPQPASPEAGSGGGLGAIEAPCDLEFFMNRHAEVGEPSSIKGEPSVAQVRDTAFLTGNGWWNSANRGAGYALRSLDSGMTWSRVDVDQFPQVDGNLCCDQRALYVPGADLVIWFLQYKPSSSTLWGGQRIAVANGRSDLRSGGNGAWHSFYFRPSDFGHPIKHWLDFPDIAYSNNYLYCASNVFDEFGNWRDSIVWRMSLAELATPVGLSVQYYRSAGQLGGDFYRLTQNATSVMYFASLRSSTTVRVFAWPDAGVVTSYDVTVPSFTANYTAPTSDGVNWLGVADECITGAYYKSGECGFMWHCGIDSPRGRPRAFVRVLRFDTRTRMPIRTEDLWSASHSFAYPACTTNSAGDIGCTVALAPTPGNPTSGSFIVDSCASSFGGQTVVHHAQATHGPKDPKWGDYFSLQRHPTNPKTFITTGMALRGGNDEAHMEPRFVWFGRESETPDWVALDVSSTPVSGAAISLSETDRFGENSGTTPFQREFAPQQGYQLVAALTVVPRGQTYHFVRWRINSVPMPDGQSRIKVDNIGTVDDTAVAEYTLRRSLSVRSTNPDSGAPITLSVADVNGDKDGQTPFQRVYNDGTQVTLDASPVHATRSFKFWVVDGVRRPAGQTSATVALDSSVIATAEYGTRLNGNYFLIGTSCPGSGGVPSLIGRGTPETAGTIIHQVIGAPANANGVLLHGFSSQLWNGTQLPFALSAFGLGNQCQLWVSIASTVPIATDATGLADSRIPVPNAPGLVARSLYSEALVIDPLVPTPLPLIATNGLETLIGGVR